MHKEIIGNATLYLGDCLEILPTLSKVDAVITDPPFNAGKAFANDNLEEKQWRSFCNRFALALWANNTSNVLIEVGKDDCIMKHEIERWLSYRYAIALNYTNSMRNGAIGFSNFGLVYWFGDGKCHSRYMDRIDAALVSNKDEFSHPTPKVIAHYSKLVSMFTPRHGVVCDPFMGSGTTGVACMNLKRSFIGIEIEPKYFDIACKRIEDAQKQLSLFDLPEVKKAEQMELFVV